MGRLLTLLAPGGKKAFTPKSISGLQLWLDASDASTISQASGSISQWNDKSGNANNATQATSALQPTYGSTLNGITAPTFAGQQTLGIPSLPSDNTTYFVAASFPSLTGNHALMGGANFWFGMYGGQYLLYQPFNPVTYAFSNAPAVYSFTSASGTNGMYAYVNNAQVVNETGPIGSVGTYVGNAEGGGNASGGPIGEVLIYNRVLSSAERSQVYNYLKAKWGTA